MGGRSANTRDRSAIWEVGQPIQELGQAIDGNRSATHELGRVEVVVHLLVSQTQISHHPPPTPASTKTRIKRRIIKSPSRDKDGPGLVHQQFTGSHVEICVLCVCSVHPRLGVLWASSVCSVMFPLCVVHASSVCVMSYLLCVCCVMFPLCVVSCPLCV